MFFSKKKQILIHYQTVIMERICWKCFYCCKTCYW